MSVKFFGQYLVDRGRITPAQLVEALSSENGRPFASLAVAKGFMEKGDAERLLRGEAVFDFDVGAVAIKKGILTEQQVAYLSFLLQSNVKMLCRNLVQSGVIPQDELDYLLSEFEIGAAEFALKPQNMPPPLAGRADIVALLSMTESMLTKYGIAPVYITQPAEHAGRIQLRDLTVRLRLSGDSSGLYVLSMDRQLAAIIAGQIFGNAKLDSVDVLIDAICEFCNLLAGAAASAVAGHGHQMEFSAPEYINPNTPFGFVTGGGRWQIQTPWGTSEILAE
jgi:CheY-specific phosphatase CheX